ncbi:MAG: hypothetical protein COW62_05595 [Zetaproteobacteria bacterium CG17_big_fil_post_rev_8_21_14_2_50_50_13]|nr:MAG: hypothetical protein AUJ56_01080 [Zetaproteobacteria bacterium CG1_02_49_23]PIQ33315.1 MAG: hypothetical protein COW62_05595 [Zetaproteobacteria bacterium CG17_big_fil_post_rev_8_21_14_2_50_50_13]PIY57051.1 MAG: hypothetical protein COZ00_00775 [Zetaproteobacteria bacterium CG_4_10_14_0_8_um_filter_49_80]
MDSCREDLLRKEQIHCLYEAIPLTVIATIINAVILTIVEWQVADHRLLLVWLVSLVVVSLARVLFFVAFRRAQAEASQNAYWERYFITGSVAAGILWGSVSFISIPEGSVIYQVFVVFVISGMCAGAVTTLSYLLLPVLSFLFFTLTHLLSVCL